MRTPAPLLLSVLIVLASLTSEALGQTFSRVYGTPGSEYVSSTVRTSDGGAIAAGYTSANGGDAQVIRFDSSGSILWQKTYGTAQSEWASSIRPTSDGGYVLLGGLNPRPPYVGDKIWVLKLDQNGSVTWQKSYSAGFHDNAADIQPTSDGGFIVAGETRRTPGAPIWGAPDAMLFKLNAQGNLVWSRVYTANDYEGFRSVRIASDGTLFVRGYLNTPASPWGTLWVLRLDANGQTGCAVCWQKTFPLVFGAGMELTNDGGLVVSGSMSGDATVLKLNRTGGVVWQETFGRSLSDSVGPIIAAPDGSFIVAGTTGYRVCPDAGCPQLPGDAWILKLNSTGAITAQKTIGGAGSEFISGLALKPDGGVIAAGGTSAAGAGGDDAWLLTLDAGLGLAASSSCAVVALADVTATSRTGSAVNATLTASALTVTSTTTSVVAAASNLTAKNYCGDPTWTRQYGKPAEWEDAADAVALADGSYVIAGTSTINGGLTDVLMLKLTPTGDVQWQKRYGGNGDDRAVAMTTSSDSGFVVVGYTFSFGVQTGDFFVMKTDSSGDLSCAACWAKTFGSASLDGAVSVQQVSDGGFVVAGNSSFGDAAWVMKLNAAGILQWQKTYAGPRNDQINSMRQTADGGMILSGRTRSFGARDLDLWLLKLDGSGTIQWQRTYGGSGADSGHAIAQTPDGGYVIAGSISSVAGDLDVWILRLDSGGDSNCSACWTKTYSAAGEDVARAIQTTQDGGLIVAGSTTGISNRDCLLMKLDMTGRVIWQHTYSASSTPAQAEECLSIKPLADGGFLVTGNASPTLAGPTSQALVLRLNSNGQTATACPLIVDSSLTTMTSTQTAGSSTPTVGTTAGVASGQPTVVVTNYDLPSTLTCGP